MLFKMKTKGKMLACLLVLSLLGFGAICFFSLANLEQMERDALKSNELLGKIAISDSKRALIEQARHQILSLALDQAYITNVKLKRIADQVNAAANLAAWHESGAWRAHEWRDGRNIISSVGNPPEEPSVYSAYSLAPGVRWDEVKDELKRIGGMHDTFKFMLFTNPHIRLIYIGMGSGLMMKYPWTLTPSGYDPRARGWYKESMKKPGKMHWTAPYVAASYGELVVSCCRTIGGENEDAKGVVAADISVDSITKDFISTQVERKGSAFLLDSQGRVIAKEGMSEVSISWDQKYEAQNLLESADAEVKGLAERMVKGGSGTLKLAMDGHVSYVGYAPVPACGWSIAIVIPESETISPALATEKSIKEETGRTETGFKAFIRERLKIFVVVALVSGLFIVLGGYFIARRITRPIVVLQEGASRIGSGELDFKLDIRTGDEIEDLAHTFNKMTGDLKDYIRNLEETTAAKQRIESDLKVAAEIQMSMLPRVFPAFPERGEFDIFASMEPAKEVGGDMYDFFLAKPGKLFVCVGDVAGKGIPAAIFMATARTLMKGLALQGLEPEEILLEANNYLAEGNDACMFITVFCGFLDTASGELTFCNAGHNPPVLLKRGDAESAHYISMKKSLPLGSFPLERGAYARESLKLSDGDALFLYTDGVTEAMDMDGALFSDAKLIETLKSAVSKGGLDPKGLVSDVRGATKVHSAGAEQSDDITILAVKFNGSES